MTSNSPTWSIDLVMLSNFGRADGGRETWAYNFIPNLLERVRDLEIQVLGFGDGENSAELLSALPNSSKTRFDSTFFPVRWKKLPLFFSMFSRLKSYNRGRTSPDVILGVGGLFELLLLLYATPTKGDSKKIMWLRTIFFHEKADKIPSILLPILTKIEAGLLRKTNIIIANGDDTAAHYRESGLEIQVIKNAVDTKRWAAKLPDLKGPIKIAFVGRLTKVKGTHEFLAMVHKMHSDGTAKDFEFHVVGHGDDETESQVNQMQKQGLLTFHGSIDNRELPKLTATFDVCVALTFKSKSCGGGGVSNALLEQMAARRIIVAWDNLIFRQLLSNEDSYLAKQGDVDHLAAKMLEIATHRKQAIAKAEKAFHIADKLSLEAHIEQFIALHVSPHE